MVSHFPYFTPEEQYKFNITIKYTDLSLHHYIFIPPQWVQLHKIPFALLIHAFNILECYSVYHYITTQICKLFDSFNNYIIYIYIYSNL